jgi:hypothetical protein
MTRALVTEAGKTWKSLHRDISNQDLRLDFEMHKQMIRNAIVKGWL